ncbi:hypothetical protein NYQ83_12165 [Afifella sp. JA880]|uniref:DUF6538 domain-containing protein n=1 Tax=Afifella sp. JA880 TaxID=2975280 RepID=UPI0021BB9490|nr:DUF6538 domain-containing protein [Afifella sp. JA880]MCT8268030.1 hypothetical protein [Afifella sp. JA880]
MHVLTRGTGSTFQIRVPSDLVTILGHTPFRTTLGFLPKREAQRRARLLAGQAEILFMRLRQARQMVGDDEKSFDTSLRSDFAAALDELAVAPADKFQSLQEYEAKLKELEQRLQEKEAALALKEKAVVDLSEGQASSAHAASTDEDTSEHPIPLFSEAAAEFLKGKREALGPKSSFVARRALALRAFRDIVGDRPLNEYRSADLQDFVAVVGRLPRDWAKSRRFAGLSLREVADANSGLRQPLPFLTTTTVNEYVAAVRTLWRSARIDYENVRPLEKAQLTLPRTLRRPTRREGIEVEHLNLWLAAAAACPRPDDRWLPLLGLLTGARLAELVYLQGQDFRRLGEHWTVDLRTDLTSDNGDPLERRVKTQAGRRVFALHKTLDELGFVDWARGRDGFIFDLLHRAQWPAHTASKRMLRQMKGVGIHLPQAGVFHSLRHTTKAWLREEGRPLGTDKRMENLQVGHALSGIDDHYGWQSLRRKEVERLATLPLLEGLDLSPYQGQVEEEREKPKPRGPVRKRPSPRTKKAKSHAR